MHASDWLIIATTATIMVASMIAGIRNQKSFVGVWAGFGILAWNTLWLNRHVPPWGAMVFFGLPSVLLVLGLALRLRSRRGTPPGR